MITRTDVFSRVIVDHLQPEGARVTWLLSRHFLSSGAYSFQLQRSSVGTSTADDWEDVGLPVTGFMATDDSRNRQGKTLSVFYRVVLTVSGQNYTSPPADTFGLLSWREWLLGRAIIRRRNLRNVKRDAADGWLLKRRNIGERKNAGAVEWSAVATDPLTGRVVNARQTLTVGTEHVGGYYEAVPLMMIFSPTGDATQRDPNRGMINDMPQAAEFVPYPLVEVRDVWIAKHTDQRYYIDRITNVSELRQVPLLCQCQLQAAPTNDAIYQIEIPEQQ